MAKECSSTTCDKSSCEGCPSKEGPQSMLEKLNEKSKTEGISSDCCRMISFGFCVFLFETILAAAVNNGKRN